MVKSSSRAGILALVLTAACFSWIFFLTHGLPIGDFDDWDHMVLSSEAPWEELIRNLLTPWSTSELWHGRGELFDQMVHERVLATSIMKFLQTIYGTDFLPFYLIEKGLFFAGAVLLIFLLSREFTRNDRVSFLGVLFWAFCPAHYTHLLWLSDPVIITQFFGLLSLYFLFKFDKGLNKRLDIAQIAWLLLWFIACSLALKTKAQGLTFALVAGLYFLTRFHKLKTQSWLQVGAAGTLISLLILMVVPVEHLFDAKQTPSQFDINNILHMVFQNTNNEFEAETSTALFSIESIFPVSIFRNIGFFGLWSLIVTLILFVISRRAKFQPAELLLASHPLGIISAAWIAIELALMGLFPPEPRYFSSTLIPITFLCEKLIAETLAGNRSWVARLLNASWIFALAFNVASFVPHILYVRAAKGARYQQSLELSQTVLKDLFPEKAAKSSLIEKARFFCLHGVENRTYSGPRLENYMYRTDVAPFHWNKTPQASIEDFRGWAAKGSRYALLFKADILHQPPRTVILAELKGWDANSLFYQGYLKFKKKKPAPLYLVKYSEI